MDLFSIQKAIRRGLKSLEAPVPQRLSEWAAENFYLSAESSYVEGAWKAYPFQNAIMDAFGNDDIEVVVMKKSARVGYTKMLVAAIGYFAHHKRRNQAVWQPTDDDADEFVKVELDTMLRDVPAMQEVFPTGKGNDKRNTLSAKVFLGSRLYIKGGKAARSYRRISVDVAILDELDGFDIDIEKEGSPDKLAGKRTEGAIFPKHIMGSTPKLKGFSRIEAREQQCDLRFLFCIPCPLCDERHPLQWGGKDKRYGMKWIDRDPETVGHACPHCGGLYNQADYLSVWEKGRWIADDGTWIDDDGKFRDTNDQIIVPPRAVAFHVWTAYSPQATWVQIVRDYLGSVTKARAGDTSELKTFTNTTLGETWEEEVEKTEVDSLEKRAEKYRLRTVPMGGLILTAGVDVQSNRFEIVVWATGRGEEGWVVDWHVIDANPADERDWEEKLDPYLQQRFQHAGGQSLGIEAVAIDTGGHFTHQSYNFCRTRSRRRIYAVKGESQPGKPVKGRSSLQDVNVKGSVLKRGVRLWMVGTDTAKDLIYGRLQVETPGPGFMHFSAALPKEFYEQLTAEVRVLQKTAHGEQYRWVKRQQRNEVLDCTVYSLFAAHTLDLHKYTDRMWAKLESAVCPAVADMFAPPPEVIEEQQLETKADFVKVIKEEKATPKNLGRRLA
ncbi:phage terminase large subunit family protein [Undibacterium sp. MH2W]|uniref:phage terminase large subunit family protein n=1 Tax=Undibacterium sp. MH2W TaxID=3413044 RepID=UPI003BF20238